MSRRGVPSRTATPAPEVGYGRLIARPDTTQPEAGRLTRDLIASESQSYPGSPIGGRVGEPNWGGQPRERFRSATAGLRRCVDAGTARLATVPPKPRALVGSVLRELGGADSRFPATEAKGPKAPCHAHDRATATRATSPTAPAGAGPGEAPFACGNAGCCSSRSRQHCSQRSMVRQRRRQPSCWHRYRAARQCRMVDHLRPPGARQRDRRSRRPPR